MGVGVVAVRVRVYPPQGGLLFYSPVPPTPARHIILCWSALLFRRLCGVVFSLRYHSRSRFFCFMAFFLSLLLGARSEKPTVRFLWGILWPLPPGSFLAGPAVRGSFFSPFAFLPPWPVRTRGAMP